MSTEVTKAMSKRTSAANKQLKDVVVKYFLSSGLVSALLGAFLTSLGAVQAGAITPREFLIGMGFMLVAMIANGVKLWADEYRKTSV